MVGKAFGNSARIEHHKGWFDVFLTALSSFRLWFDALGDIYFSSRPLFKKYKVVITLIRRHFSPKSKSWFGWKWWRTGWTKWKAYTHHSKLTPQKRLQVCFNDLKGSLSLNYLLCQLRLALVPYELQKAVFLEAAGGWAVIAAVAHRVAGPVQVGACTDT